MQAKVAKSIEIDGDDCNEKEKDGHDI